MNTRKIKNSPEDLISGYLNRELSPDETGEFISWIRSDPSNQRLFDEYAELWISAKAISPDRLSDYRDGFAKFRETIKADIGRTSYLKGSSLIRMLVRYAAIFIIAASLSGILFYSLGSGRVKSTGQHDYELKVPMGSHAQFTLGDGSSVILNAGSCLKYNGTFGFDNRIVELEGEAYFSVAKNKNMPFTVKTSHLNVVALGTVFNIKAYREDKIIETTLVEGSVSIEEITAPSGKGKTILGPNQKLTFFKQNVSGAGKPVSKKKEAVTIPEPSKEQTISPVTRLVTDNVDVEPVVSWKENRWIFERQSLSQIAVDLERRFDVLIVFESERLKNFRFTGTIIAEPIEQVLEVMSITAPIRFRVKGRTVTISENKKSENLYKQLYNRN